MDVIDRLIPQAAEHLSGLGSLLLEISPMLQQQVEAAIRAEGRLEYQKTINDLAGLPRVVVARTRASLAARIGKRTMDCLRVIGGVALRGTVPVSGSKNAALPIMAASILAGGPVALANVPDLADVNTLAFLLGHLGVEVKRRPDGDVAHCHA